MTSAASPRLLLLYSDTGGGHRSAAEALAEALQRRAGGRIRLALVDFLKDYAPFPYRRLPAWYPHMVRFPRLWALGYRLTNSPRRLRPIHALTRRHTRRASLRLLQDHPADLIVSLHPLANDPAARALARVPPARRPPLTVVVTDLVSTHAFWHHPAADLTLVPTEPARQRALACGLNPERIQVHGLPVSRKFTQPQADPEPLRRALGWCTDRPTILLIGGGDGMGPLARTAAAIDQAGFHAGLAIVTGRNQKLRRKLEARNWQIPAFVYGFVHNMPDLMRAAHILVTKAGPGTISEALIAGLPILLYARLPGQESGNVDWLTQNGAGIWAATPAAITAAIRRWLDNPAAHQQAAANARRLARPNAADEIASVLLTFTKVS
jgi:1,2-diacylglycerol 3-beta-galactosyltransferase